MNGHEIWKAIWDLTKAVSEVILATLPNFWRVAKSYLDGRFKKVIIILILTRPGSRFSPYFRSMFPIVAVHRNVVLWRRT
jgi:hypothetical protein